MVIKRGNRTDLIEALADGGGAPTQGCYDSDAFPVQPLAGDHLYIIWESQPDEHGPLPTTIVVADGHMRDFLAWTSTFFPGFRPFTAFFRVLDFSILRNLEGRSIKPCLGSLEKACAGLIIGEALTLASDHRHPEPLSVVACSSTISYCLTRALALGGTARDFEIICDKWATARNLTNEPERRLDFGSLHDVWLVAHLSGSATEHDEKLPSSSGGVRLVVEACIQMRDQGKISDETWSRLTYGDEKLQRAPRKMEGPREERVQSFREAISGTFSIASGEGFLPPFIWAYLVSLIGPGSMSHLDLLIPQMGRMSTVLLWYGLCAGLHPRSDLLSQYNALGRRLIRNALAFETSLSRPISDISVAELEILRDKGSKSTEFRTFSKSHMVVELLPFIYTYIGVPQDRVTVQQELLVDPAGGIAGELLSELGSHIEQSAELHRLLVDIVSRSYPSKQLTGNETGYLDKRNKPGRKK